MISSAFHKLREEPGTAFAAMFGVVLIVALLWAIGHVAQGQVRQAQARNSDQVQAQAMALRCGPVGATSALAACADRSEWSAEGAGSGTGQPVYVSYR